MQVNEELQDKIQRISNLPTLPQVASRLIQSINDPLTSSSDIAFVVSQDLSLSAKILRLANSAFYGIPRSITNINNAVVILGLKVIHTMVLSLTVFDLFPEDKRLPNRFDRKAFWMHSLACGTVAKLFASRIKKFVLFDPEEAFCAGLLHDIGKVVMEQYIHSEFHDALQIANNNKMNSFKIEKNELGFTHTDVAQWLVSRWGLPDEIQLPIIFHHTPALSTQCHDIVYLCHYADWFCYEKGISKSSGAPDFDANSEGMLKLTESDITSVAERLPGELEKMNVFFDIATNV